MLIFSRNGDQSLTVGTKGYGSCFVSFCQVELQFTSMTELRHKTRSTRETLAIWLEDFVNNADTFSSYGWAHSDGRSAYRQMAVSSPAVE